MLTQCLLLSWHLLCNLPAAQAALLQVHSSVGQVVVALAVLETLTGLVLVLLSDLCCAAGVYAFPKAGCGCMQPQDAYGLEKLASEELAMHYDKDFGIECRIAR